MSEIKNRTITINRTFNAPLSLVWEAWTQADHIAKWWGRGMLVNIVEHNFSVGGEWKYTMAMPDGMEFISKGIYSKIEEQQLIETSADFIPMTEGVTLVANFSEVDEKTELVFEIIHPTEEYAKQQEDMGIHNGWGSVFEALDNYLAALVV